MPAPDAMIAIREGATITRLDHVQYVRVRGPEAWTLLNGVSARALRVRDGQVLPTLLLTRDARIFADVFIAQDDEDFLLLVEGPSLDDLIEYLRHHAGAQADVEIVAAGTGHQLLGLDGPYAWELLARVMGAEVIGLPFLTFFHGDDWTCARLGKTGEYGYVLIAPDAAAATLLQRLRAEGVAFDLVDADLAVLDQCALENGFLNIRREGSEPVTPLELQLQWRLGYDRTFVGSEQLARIRTAGIQRRLTWLVSPAPVTVGAMVSLGGATVGRVVNAGYSASRGDWVAAALIDVGYAHPGIPAFTFGANGAAARSVSPPVLNNRSLHISAQAHSYHTRAEHPFPALPRG